MKIRALSAKKQIMKKNSVQYAAESEIIEEPQEPKRESQSLINKEYLRQMNQIHINLVEKEPKKPMIMSFDCAEYVDQSKNDQNYQKFKDNYLQKIQIHDYEVSEAQKQEDLKFINKTKKKLAESSNSEKKVDPNKEQKKQQPQTSHVYLNQIKENSLANLRNVLNNKIKVKWIEKTKKEFNEFQMEAKDLIEKESQLAKQNQHEVKQLQQKILKQKEEIIQLEKKQKQYQNQFYEYKTKYDELYCDNQSLLKHKKTMDLFSQKYPEMTLEKLLEQFEQTKNTCNELQMKNDDFEYKRYQHDKDRQVLEEKFKIQEQNLQEKISQLNKQIKQLNQTVTYMNDSQNSTQSQDFKKLYLQLNNRVLDLYNDWKSKIIIFNKKNQADYPQADLSSPIQIVDVLEKCIKFNTSEKLQDYLRKIIISANQLRRMCCPELANLRFEPDKLYEQIINYVKNLNQKLQTLNREKGNQKKHSIKNSDQKNIKKTDQISEKSDFIDIEY